MKSLIRLATLSLLLGTAVIATAAPRTRVASLLPYVSDALERIPTNVDLVASVTDGSYVIPKGTANLGNPHSPSFEELAAARPSIIIGDRRLHGVIQEKLARSGAKVVLIEGSSVEGTFNGLIAAGDAAGAGAEMRVLVAKARKEIDALRLARSIDVLPLFGTSSTFMAVTAQTWLGDLLRDLHFRNLAAAATGNMPFPGYVELSDETMSTFRPQKVFLVAHGAPDAVEQAFRRKKDRGGAWTALASNVTVLPASLFGRNPGLRMPEAARQLIALSTRASR